MSKQHPYRDDDHTCDGYGCGECMLNERTRILGEFKKLAGKWQKEHKHYEHNAPDAAMAMLYGYCARELEETIKRLEK